MQAEKLPGYHCPRWQELPDIPLYLDQLIMILQNAIGIFYEPDEPAVTKAMINNYVKQKLIEPPEQKKYERGQIAMLIVISLLKRVFSMSEISRLTETAFAKNTPEEDYDIFCAKLEQLLFIAFEEDGEVPLPLLGETKELAALNAAVASLVCKLRVQAMLPPEPEKKKE